MTWLIVIGSIVGLLVLAFLAFMLWSVLDDRKIRKVESKFKEQPPREQLLGFGALMISRNGDSPRTLHMRAPDTKLRDGLVEMWGVTDAASARQAVDGLMRSGHRGHYDKDFSRLQEGAELHETKSFSGSDLLRWEVAQKIWEKVGLPLTNDRPTTMAAFDYERIGFLARTCYVLGYLTEDETWRCLLWTARHARGDFSSWHEYAASYVFGRAVAYEDDDADEDDADLTWNGINSARGLLSGKDTWTDAPPIWQQYPLETLEIDEDEVLKNTKPLPRTGAKDDRDVSRQQLLGLGALSYRLNDFGNELTFAIDDRSRFLEWFAGNFDIASKTSAEAILKSLIENGARSETDLQLGTTLQAWRDGDEAAVPATVRVRLDLAARMLETAGISRDHIEQCRSVLGYDLEIAAFAARVSHTVGYLSEEEAWSYLQKIALRAQKAYQDWTGYFVSYVLSTACLTERSLEEHVSAGLELLQFESPFAEFRSPWQEYPLPGLLHIREVT